MKCQICDNHIQAFEIYTSFYYCNKCDKTYDYNRKEKAQRKSPVAKSVLDKKRVETEER